MGASVWRVGRTAEDRLMYKRSIKAAASGNGFSERERMMTIVIMVLKIMKLFAS